MIPTPPHTATAAGTRQSFGTPPHAGGMGLPTGSLPPPPPNVARSLLPSATAVAAASPHHGGPLPPPGSVAAPSGLAPSTSITAVGSPDYYSAAHPHYHHAVAGFPQHALQHASPLPPHLSLMSRRVDIHPADAYVVAATDTTRRKHEDTSLPAKMVRMKRRWDEHGTIRSVEAVMLVHRHRHPHVVLLELDNGAAGKTFRLPGGKCPIEADALGDPDTETLLKKLQRKLFSATVGMTAAPPAAAGGPAATGGPSAPPAGSPAGTAGLIASPDDAAGAPTTAAPPPPVPTGTTLANGTVLPLRVGELLSTWYRPNYEALMYPYAPPHITRPKEVRNVYLVHLEPDVTFTVPRHMRVVAVPLFELYDNAAKYGSVIAGVPHMVSRLVLSPT